MITLFDSLRDIISLFVQYSKYVILHSQKAVQQLILITLNQQSIIPHPFFVTSVGLKYTQWFWRRFLKDVEVYLRCHYYLLLGNKENQPKTPKQQKWISRSLVDIKLEED